jgi:hydroxyacylglutathione hydrolase
MKSWITRSGYRIIRVLAGRSNVFLLSNGKMNILIDTSAKFMYRRLDKGLRQLNVTVIDYLILTHTHFDHAANAFRIKEKYSAKVIVHESEASYLNNGENIVPQGTNLVTRTLVNLLGKLILSRAKYQPCQYDILVDSVLDLNFAGFNARIIHTPGHSPGSMSVVIDDEIAVVGDAMFGISKWSVFPPYANDIKQMIKSWGVLLETKCSVFLPAHGSANSRELVLKDYNKRR